jgi:TolA-binding protein
MALEVDVQATLEEARSAANRAAVDAQAQHERLERVLKWLENRSVDLGKLEKEIQDMQVRCAQLEESQRKRESRLREEEVQLGKNNEEALRMQVNSRPCTIFSGKNGEGCVA